MIFHIHQIDVVREKGRGWGVRCGTSLKQRADGPVQMAHKKVYLHYQGIPSCLFDICLKKIKKTTLDTRGECSLVTRSLPLPFSLSLSFNTHTHSNTNIDRFSAVDGSCHPPPIAHLSCVHSLYLSITAF